MALIVTPGASDAESYASIAEINAYAVKHGASFPITGDDGPATAAAIAAAEAAARRATAWLDNEYGPRFIGEPASSSQALEWPRANAWFRCEELPDDTIPQKIRDATAEAAIRELAAPGSLAPDVSISGVAKRRRVGDVETEFAGHSGSSQAKPSFSVIDGHLNGLLKSVSDMAWMLLV